VVDAGQARYGADSRARAAHVEGQPVERARLKLHISKPRRGVIASATHLDHGILAGDHGAVAFKAPGPVGGCCDGWHERAWGGNQ